LNNSSRKGGYSIIHRNNKSVSNYSSKKRRMELPEEEVEDIVVENDEGVEEPDNDGKFNY
jgi:hypothetical protein